MKVDPKVLFRSVILNPQPRVMALELLKNFMSFCIYLLIFLKSAPSPCLIAEEFTFLILYLLATLKFGRKEKFEKFVKVCSQLFVCFTRCCLNNYIPLPTTNSKCYRNIYIK